MTDEELMLAYASGADAAFRELFQRYAPILLRLLGRYVGRAADAEDLAQQTFLQLHRARGDFRRGTPFRPWVFTIALNLARDLLRRRVRRPETEVKEDTVVVRPTIEDRDDAHVRVRAAVNGLPKEQREVIELHWFEELSFNEIASIVGASSGAARVRAHRGYEALRMSLARGEVGSKQAASVRDAVSTSSSPPPANDLSRAGAAPRRVPTGAAPVGRTAAT